VPIIGLNYDFKSISYSDVSLGDFRVVRPSVCLLFVNINRQTYKQNRKKPFLSKQKLVDRDGFCESQDAFCDMGSEIGLGLAEIVSMSGGFWVPAKR
jgi:hypothetical protein